jgi:protein-S-isoprenylcysteine O-methyltransferase Ste14
MPLLILWRDLSYLWIGSEVVIAIATRTRNSSGNVRDRGTIYLLWLVLFTSITAGSWYGETHTSNLFGGAAWLKLASVFLMIAGLLLRWTAIVMLGKSFSSNVAIHATQTVMKTGLYRWMRHPSYTGLLLSLYAVALHTRNWISLLIIVIPATAALLYRIHVEEIALRDHFGSEYIEYSRKTKRLLPGIY